MGTVEPPNKGHFGTSRFVLCREVVLSQRLRKSDPQNNSSEVLCSVSYVYTSCSYINFLSTHQIIIWG